MSALGSLVVSLALDYAQYTQGLDKSDQAALKFAQNAQRNFDAASASVTDFLKGSAAQAAAAIGGIVALNESFNRSLEFSKSLAQISTQLDGAGDDLSRLEAAAKSLAVQFGTLPIDQTRAFYEIISAGIEDTTQATEILTTANKLAIVGVTDLATSVSGLTDIMNSYEGKVESAEAVSDALFVGMKAGKASMEDFTAHLAKVTPFATALNVSFDELVAAIAALSKTGGETSEKITGLRAILASIAKPSVEAARLANQLGLEFNASALQAKGLAGFLEEVAQKTGGSVDTIAKLFGGVEALVPMLALAGKAGKDFAQIMQLMAEKAGATEEALEKISVPGDKFKNLMSSLEVVALSVGDALANVLAPAAGAAADAINNLYGIQPQTSAIDQQKQKIMQLRAELESIADFKNLPLIGEKFFPQRKFDLKSGELDSAIQDQYQMAIRVTQQLTKAETSNKESKESLTKVENKLTEEQQKFIDKIREEAAQAGKSSTEILRMQAAKLDVLGVTGSLIDQIEREKTALEGSKKTAQEKAAADKRAEEIYQGLIQSVQGKTAANKIEIELGRSLNEIDKIKLDIDAKVLAGELRLTEAKKQKIQAELQEFQISQELLKNQKFIQESSASLAKSGFDRVTSIKEEVKVLQDQNAMLGMTAEQVKEFTAARTLEEAQAIRNAAAYAGPLHDAYIKYADDLVEVAGYQKRLIEERQIAKYAQDFSNAFSQIEQTGRNAFVQFAAHGTNAMESIGEAIKLSIIDLLYQLTVRKWIINIGTSVEGMLFGQSSNPGTGTAGGSGGIGLGDLFNMGSSAMSAVKMGSNAATLYGSFNAGLQGGTQAAQFIAAESATMGAGMAADAGASVSGLASQAGFSGMQASSALSTGLAGLGGGIVGTFGGSMIAGDKKIHGVDGTTSASIGSTIGGMIGAIWGPVGAAIGALLGGLAGGAVNALFGRGPLKQKETNLIGDITTEGFSGITSTKFKAEGGAFISDKIDRIMIDTDTGEQTNSFKGLVEGGISKELKPLTEDFKTYATELGIFLDKSIKEVSRSVFDVAKNMNINTDVLKDFSMEVNIASEKGKVLSDEQLGQVLTDVTETMVKELVPGIAELGKVGETVLQTMDRLSGEFNSLDGALTILTRSSDKAKDMLSGISFADRTKIIEEAGGVDVINSQMSFFNENFNSPGDMVNIALEQVNAELNKLGLTADITKEQYGDLIRSVTEVGGVSIETAGKLLELAPAFLVIKNAAEELKNSVNQNLLSLAGNLAPDEVLGIKYSMMSDALSQFGISADISREQLIEYVREFVNSGGLLTAAAESVMSTVGITLDYLNSVDLKKANADQNLLSLAGMFAPEEVTGLKRSMANDALSQFGLSVDMGREAITEALREFVNAGGVLTEEMMRAAGITADFFNSIDQDNLNAVNAAYAALQRSVDAERTRLTNEYNTALNGINTQIENVTDSISKLKSLSDALKNTVNAIRPMERSEAKAQIEAALNTARSGGGLPNVEDISQALDVLKQQSTSGFTSSFDFAFEQAKTASMLGELGALTDDQLSTEERSLNALKESKKSLEDGFKSEMTRLDKILEDAKTQIDILNGIETNTKTIADALQNFQAAINTANASGSGSAGSGGGEGFSSFSFSGSGIKTKASDAEIKAFVDANINDPLKIYNKALELGYSSGDISKATGISIDQINATTDALGVPRLSEAVTPSISATPTYGISDQLVSDFYQANKNDLLKVAKTAQQFDVNIEQLSRSIGVSIADINKFYDDNGLKRLDSRKGFAAGGFTGAGGKFEEAGIVHKGEYVFSQESVRNIGVHALDQLHESAKRGEPEGYADGGLVGAQNIINRTDVNRIDSITDKNVIDARSIFEERTAANDIARELTKQHESIKDIASMSNVFNALNNTNSISNIDNVINARHVFENRVVSSKARHDLISSVGKKLIDASFVSNESNISNARSVNDITNLSNAALDSIKERAYKSVTNITDRDTRSILNTSSISDESQTLDQIKRISSIDENIRSVVDMRDIESTASTLNAQNDIKSISDINNVIDAKRIFEKTKAANDVIREQITQANILKDVINAAYIQSQHDRSRKSIFDHVRELQHVELNRGFASGGYTGNAGTDEPVGIVHGREYVFSATAVENIGLDTLEKLHKAGKDGKPSGFAEGGFVDGDIGPVQIVENTRPNTATTNNNQSIQLNQDDVVAELRLLREEIKQVREYNRRMSNRFDAVTQGGTAFRTKTA
ncbi:phage tail tape measure protein [Nitrosomonas communis]|uniref:phage tail tape measure protein n=1 Tax=Nitrosomonas communis TaxID=44574 RepID=UPI003D27E7F8